MTSVDLYFGRAIPGGGLVSEVDWQHFVEQEITPRFPGGLTISDAQGQWKGEGGIVRESSKRLFVMVPGSYTDTGKLQAIRDSYRARFRQESVLIVATPVCGAF